MAETRLVLMRHGQSLGNEANQFTGWNDLDLSPDGHEEARRAGRLMRAHGFRFDAAHCSMLRRTIHTLHHCLDELDQTWLPEYRSWRLNERHYGALQGLNRDDTIARYGREQVQQWRRGFDITPPEVELDSPHYPGNDSRYATIPRADLPRAESLATTMQRVLPYWKETLLPSPQRGQSLLVITHGTVMRALIGHLNDLNPEEARTLEIPTGTPLVYEVDAGGMVERAGYL
ncbi:2,3-diphosphoglycerate-dependent phosphoglycerate mutase [Bombella sp. TMW 2.2559]|uniref:2,3-bisphosphoglycerate-dependent phosphoglycerate mutase n=1 Tax=Bombella dulcis TaxID=2967339 RepID=A0ABT3WC97_9PROT|nr:2,3-diphosphoglycerate-dependent phosphoglycerate mutase [Bombella dulcis]MCX5615392.1 2,3-diphosphoglycerate-dependent phosphoglycerate mutase [Bombella dulcis]